MVIVMETTHDTQNYFGQLPIWHVPEQNTFYSMVSVVMNSFQVTPINFILFTGL